MKQFKDADTQTLQALLNMRTTEMRPLLEFIRVLSNDTKDALMRAPENGVAKLQGRALLLEEFIEAVDTAESVLTKLRGKAQSK